MLSRGTFSKLMGTFSIKEHISVCLEIKEYIFTPPPSYSWGDPCSKFTNVNTWPPRAAVYCGYYRPIVLQLSNQTLGGIVNSAVTF